LVHYDAAKELLPSCDTSIGAVLSHRDANGKKSSLLIVFASRSLSKAKQKYAHLDKEGLTIVFGVRHFHPYLFGRTFTIFSDHKPIFSET